MSMYAFGDNEIAGNLRQAFAEREQNWKRMLRTNQDGMVVNASASLIYDDYKELTRKVVEAREFANTGILYRMLVAKGLVESVSINKTLVDFNDQNENIAAIVSMDASNRTTGATNFAQKVVPLPIIHTDLVIPWREGGFDYKQTRGTRQKVFEVGKTRDLMLLNGDSNIVVNGTALKGVTNATGILTDTISDWANPATTGATIRSEAVTLTKQLLTDAKVSNPKSCVMFVAADVYGNLEGQYSTSYEAGSIKKNLLSIDLIEDVVLLPGLADGAVLIIEMMPNTIDLAVATDIITMPWAKSSQIQDGRFTVMASCTPRVFTDRNGKTGIMYATK